MSCESESYRNLNSDLVVAEKRGRDSCSLSPTVDKGSNKTSWGREEWVHSMYERDAKPSAVLLEIFRKHPTIKVDNQKRLLDKISKRKEK